jgi:hypothetical protein
MIKRQIELKIILKITIILQKSSLSKALFPKETPSSVALYPLRACSKPLLKLLIQLRANLIAAIPLHCP